MAPSPQCRYFRVEVDIELYWKRAGIQPTKALTVATKWQPFLDSIPFPSSDAGKVSESLGDDLVAGLQLSHTAELLASTAYMGITLRQLTDFLSSDLNIFAVAAQPADELLLPIPLPHSLGQLLEWSLDVRFWH